MRNCIHAHGKGVVLMLLEGLQTAHAVRTEATQHGLFVKLLYARDGKRSSYPQTLLLSDLLPNSCSTARSRRQYGVPPSYLPPFVPNRCEDAHAESSDPVFEHDPWKENTHDISCGGRENDNDCWASWSGLLSVQPRFCSQADPSTVSQSKFENNGESLGSHALVDQGLAPSVTSVLGKLAGSWYSSRRHSIKVDGYQCSFDGDDSCLIETDNDGICLNGWSFTQFMHGDCAVYGRVVTNLSIGFGRCH